MISPRTDPAPGGDDVSIRDATDAFFRPGGSLQKACAGEAFPYEPRPQQREMALAVADAVATDRHLAVEAGTGVGKSFAYLVPAVLAARLRKVHVVVSTYTISLQEQLIYKDIPFLRQHMGVDFKAVLVKGRSNYLCLRRMARARRMEGDLFDTDGARDMAMILEWAGRTEEGSLQDMQRQPSPHVWSFVCAEVGNCLGQKCPEHEHCFFMKARRRIRDAHLLVVNHHLFFADLSLRGRSAGFLPRYAVVVLDEAHQVENVAGEHFGLRLSHHSFEYLMRRLYVPEGNKGLLAVLREGRAAQEVTRLREEVERLFVDVHDWASFKAEESQRVVAAPLDLATEVPARLERLGAQLKEIIEKQKKDDDLCAELTAAMLHSGEMKAHLEAFLQQALNDHVYWIEREGRRRLQTVLYAAPIEVAPLLEKTLFEGVPCVVMTSATLAVDDRLDYFKSRVGAVECEGLSVGSPFEYTRQMRVVVATNLPDPNDAERFGPEAARAIGDLVVRSRGQAFVLFTSARLMRQVADLVAERLEDEGLKLFVQGAGLPRHVMLERFRQEEGSVLFGLDSFWMGVDVRGEALSTVIITRLPFAVPDQPVVKARMDRIRERGGDPFRDFSLPEAILKFRQGVGRLIRTATDTGTIVVLDGRIVQKRYGRMFLSSIPECPVDLAEV
ncbi:MAG: hypothetical protein JXB04_06675 [Kiritimatiellae bacterium]|nr:hypothetical protein [Kiritimatiellia bacterium]